MSTNKKDVTTERVREDFAPVNNRLPDFKTVYANNTAFSMNAFDLALTFGEIVDVQGNHPIVEQSVRVVMTPLHAKIFVNVLLENLSKYEEQYGEIKLPEAAMKVAERSSK